jgi:hypothetical protein
MGLTTAMVFLLNSVGSVMGFSFDVEINPALDIDRYVFRTSLANDGYTPVKELTILMALMEYLRILLH